MTTRRAFLAGGLLGASLAPGRLLAAAEKHTPPMPKLDGWASVRAQFRLSKEHANFAGFYIASHPAPVRDAIDAWRRALDEEPFLTVEHGMFESQAENAQRKVREEVAAYLGGKQDEIALTPNTTTGLALVYHGLSLKPGDEILTTTHDHVVHHESIRLSTERNGASSRRIALFDDAATATVDGIVARVRENIRPNTRVVGITWVHSATGMRLPVREIAAALKGKDVVLIVDGVHGLGCTDETIAEMGADFFCAGTHKWMFAPRGTGIVYASAANWSMMRPVVPDFMSPEHFESWRPGKAAPPIDALQMSPGGFLAYEHQWGMKAAFEMHQKMGRARVAGRVRELNERIRTGLAGIDGVTLHTPRDAELSAGINCFEVKGLEPGEVVAKLLAKKIVASTSPYATSYARLCGGLVNDPDDVDRALQGVRSIATV
jgi:selenocysteine lyase/cysteine desulfurase